MLNELIFSEHKGPDQSKQRILQILSGLDIGLSTIQESRRIYPKIYVIGKGITTAALDLDTGWFEQYYLQGKELIKNGNKDFIFNGGMIITSRKLSSTHSAFFRENNWPYISTSMSEDRSRTYQFPILSLNGFYLK